MTVLDSSNNNYLALNKPTDAIRSDIMRKIRKTNTKPELIVRKYLFKNGFRFRIHLKSLPGSPDIVLKKFNTVIFVNGCFWHAHENCRLNRPPKTRQEYWLPKIERNVQRDQLNKRKLNDLGWRVITIWECEIRNYKQNGCLDKLAMDITN